MSIDIKFQGKLFTIENGFRTLVHEYVSPDGRCRYKECHNFNLPHSQVNVNVFKIPLFGDPTNNKGSLHVHSYTQDIDAYSPKYFGKQKPQKLTPIPKPKVKNMWASPYSIK